jgi:hypothetical protein
MPPASTGALDPDPMPGPWVACDQVTTVTSSKLSTPARNAS